MTFDRDQHYQLLDSGKVWFSSRGGRHGARKLVGTGTAGPDGDRRFWLVCWTAVAASAKHHSLFTHRSFTASSAASATQKNASKKRFCFTQKQWRSWVRVGRVQ